MARYLLLLTLVAGAAGLDNGLARTPQMGYNSWYDLLCTADMNEAVLRETADALVSTGLRDLGYQYLNLDDCWAKGRYDNGTVYPDPTTFPSGMKALADYVHSKGLKFGVYSDRGDKTCAGRPGALGHEEIDAKTYAEWGVDYLKEDSCNAPGDHETAFAEYGKMRDSLNATGRPILFSLCGWSSWYAPKGFELGNSWRIGPDDNGWNEILKNIDINAGLQQYAGPGGWNDPCLLRSVDAKLKYDITMPQIKAQFAMWAVMASPLLISGNIRNMPQDILAVYKNRAIIAVNQDPLGKQGRRIRGGDLASRNGTNVWVRDLQDGAHAMVFVNTANTSKLAVCDEACFLELKYTKGSTIVVTDLWSGETRRVSPPSLQFALDAEGGSAMVRVQEAQ